MLGDYNTQTGEISDSKSQGWEGRLRIFWHKESALHPLFEDGLRVVKNAANFRKATKKEKLLKECIWYAKKGHKWIHIKCSFKTREGEKKGGGDSLAVQWLGLCTLTAKDTGSIPGQGTEICKPCGMAKNLKI